MGQRYLNLYVGVLPGAPFASRSAHDEATRQDLAVSASTTLHGRGLNAIGARCEALDLRWGNGQARSRRRFWTCFDLHRCRLSSRGAAVTSECNKGG
jgi:hypothetical protein